LTVKNQLLPPAPCGSEKYPTYSLPCHENENLRLLLRCEWKYLGRQYFDLANTIDRSAYHTLNTRFGLTTKKGFAHVLGKEFE